MANALRPNEPRLIEWATRLSGIVAIVLAVVAVLLVAPAGPTHACALDDRAAVQSLSAHDGDVAESDRIATTSLAAVQMTATGADHAGCCGGNAHSGASCSMGHCSPFGAPVQVPPSFPSDGVATHAPRPSADLRPSCSANLFRPPCAMA